MAAPPTRRYTALDDTLHTLDDAFMATLTPTNTWLDNVQPPSEDGEDDTPTVEDYSVHFRHDRLEGPPKSKHSISPKTSLPEPESSPLPPASSSARSTPIASVVLEPQSNVSLEQFLQLDKRTSEADSLTSSSRACSTQDDLFSASPWIPEEGNRGTELFSSQDLRSALEGRFQDTNSSSGSARHSEMLRSVHCDTGDSDIMNEIERDDGRDDPTMLCEDADDGVAYMDTNIDIYAGGSDTDLEILSPSFQMRVFNPGSLEYESSRKHSAEMIENAAQEWSSDVQELSAIAEEEYGTEEATQVSSTYVKRRSSDIGLHFSTSSSGHGMRRISTMSDYQRLKGRHKSPKLVAFKADPAGPVITAMSVQPSDAWKDASLYEDAANVSSESSIASGKASQTTGSDLGISQLVWQEPSSSSDSDITVLIGTGIDYVVADEVEGDTASPSPMERLKSKLKAWSWERELSEASPDRRYRFNPEERSHRRQSSDYLEVPPGPPNTIRDSGQSSTIHSDPQTPADLEASEEDEDESGLELRAINVTRATHIQPSTATSSSDYPSVPRRTNSLPSSPSVVERDSSDFPHRDSVDISHVRIDWDEIRNKRDQELIMNSRDSFLITKSRLEAKHPKAGNSVTSPGGAIRWNRFAGLDTIADASPPGLSLLEARKGKQKVVQEECNTVDAEDFHEHEQEDRHEHEVEHEVEHSHKHKHKHKPKHGSGKDRHQAARALKKKVEVVEAIKPHPDEHEDCPICEVHRPRWYEVSNTSESFTS